MCLKTTELALYWNEEEQAYVGTGYKTYNSLSSNYNELKLKTGQWFNFNPDKFRFISKCMLLKDTLQNDRYCEKSHDRKEYVPGFHIFLKAIDAKDYDNRYLYEVMYKNVLAFGINMTQHYSETYGQCVIAADMKIVRKLNKRSIKGK